MRGTFPILVAVVKDKGPLGGNLTVWAAEMEGSEVANLNLGWQRRWTPSCIADSPLSTILVVFQVEESIFSRPNHRGRRLQAIGAGVEHPIPNTEIHGESGPEKGGGKYNVL